VFSTADILDFLYHWQLWELPTKFKCITIFAPNIYCLWNSDTMSTDSACIQARNSSTGHKRLPIHHIDSHIQHFPYYKYF
jgi:hypothetical protein